MKYIHTVKFSLNHLTSLLVLTLMGMVHCNAQDRNQVMNIVYPEGAFHQNGGPVVNIKNTPLFSPNAAGDGVTDDTAAFVAMMDYLKGRLVANGNADPGLIFYVPTGTYLVSDTIIHSGSHTNFCYLRLVGQNRNNTTIRLKNNSNGFGAGQQKPVIAWTKHTETYQGNVLWGNQLRNITINTGSGNPGAVGMTFFGANSCSIDNVAIKSQDGTGHTGLSFPGWSVQGHFSDITVDGFDYGIRCDDRRETNPVLEYITVKNQNVTGLRVGRAGPSVRKFRSENTVPAIMMEDLGGHLVLVDAQLTGGASSNSAITLQDSSTMQLFTRNITVSGYGSSVRMDGATAVTGNITEWLSGEVYSVDESTPPQTLGLPIEEVQLVPWQSNVANWASPEDYSGTVAERIQAALNSGKPAVYFPKAYSSSVIFTVPASVRQMDFMFQNHALTGGFHFNQSSSNAVWIEHARNRQRVVVAAQRDLHVRFSGLRYRVETSEPVTVHFQSLGVLADGNRTDFCPSNVTVYARSINEEAKNNTNFLVNGGSMWVLGYKTESKQIAFEARNGAFLEVLGGYHNFAGGLDAGNPTLLNNNSHVSYIGTNHMSRNYQAGLREILDGVTYSFPNAEFPRRNVGHGSGNYFVPLYVGYDPDVLDGPGAGSVILFEDLFSLAAGVSGSQGRSGSSQPWTIDLINGSQSSVGHAGSSVTLGKSQGTGTKQSAIRRIVNTTGHPNVAIILTAHQSGVSTWQNTDSLVLEYRLAAGSPWTPLVTDVQRWTAVQDTQGDGDANGNTTPTATATINLPSQAGNTTTLEIRVRGSMNSTAEAYSLNEIQLIALAGGGSSADVVFEDDFALAASATGTTGRTGSTLPWTIELPNGSQSLVAHDPTGAVLLGKGGGIGPKQSAISRTVDTTGHATVSVVLEAYQTAAASWQATDSLLIEYRLSPSDAWTPLLTDAQRWQGIQDNAGDGNASGNATPTSTASLPLPAGAGNNPQLGIRLRSTLNSTSESYFLGNLRVED